METKKHIYTTVNGTEVEYQAISLDALKMSKRGLERAYRERGEPLDIPTYKWKTASGAEIEDPHDETTPKDETEKSAWDAYKDARRRLDYAQAELVMRYILDDGLVNIIVPEDTSWQQKYKDRYIEVPTDPQELRDFYITAVVLPTKEDRERLTNSVMLLSEHGKVDPDALEARLEMFRGAIRRRAERKAAERANASKEQMEAQPETNGA